MSADNDDTLSVFSLSSDVSISSGKLEADKPHPALVEDQPYNSLNQVPVDRHSHVPLEQRHRRFFIPEDSITLKVESVYFNVPIFVLKAHSKRFQKILTKGENIDEELASLLEGVTVIDLERFLSIIFPTSYDQCDVHTVEEWSSILKVAHLWEAESIIRLALEWIEPHATPVDLVVLGAQYNLPEWLNTGRLRLCRREEPLSEEEANRMGMKEVIRISAARHHIRPSQVQRDVKDSTILSLLQEKNVDEHPKDPAGPGPCEGDKHEGAYIDGGHAVTPQESLTTPTPSRISCQERISRALELRKQVHDLDGRFAAMDQTLAQFLRPIETIAAQERVREELRKLFEDLDVVNNPPTYMDLNGVSSADAAVLLELLLEQHLRPGMITQTLHIRISLQEQNISISKISARDLVTTLMLQSLPMVACLPTAANFTEHITSLYELWS